MFKILRHLIIITTSHSSPSTSRSQGLQSEALELEFKGMALLLCFHKIQPNLESITSSGLDSLTLAQELNSNLLHRLTKMNLATMRLFGTLQDFLLEPRYSCKYHPTSQTGSVSKLLILTTHSLTMRLLILQEFHLLLAL